MWFQHYREQDLQHVSKGPQFKELTGTVPECCGEGAPPFKLTVNKQYDLRNITDLVGRNSLFHNSNRNFYYVI